MSILKHISLAKARRGVSLCASILSFKQVFTSKNAPSSPTTIETNASFVPTQVELVFFVLGCVWVQREEASCYTRCTAVSGCAHKPFIQEYLWLRDK